MNNKFCNVVNKEYICDERIISPYWFWLNNLLVSLYQNQSIPANIPLTEFEREAILDKLGFNNT